jgi:hypothetical protein
MESFVRCARPCLTMILAAIVLPFAARVVFAAPPSHACDLPQGLQPEIATKYPGARVVQLSDLAPDDKASFQSDHGNACPGLAKVDFYGDGKSTLAIVLLIPKKPENESRLIVAHETKAWNIMALDTGGTGLYAPMVWTGPSGKVTDIESGKTINAAHPVIVFGTSDSWTIVYAWIGKKVDKVWIMD